MAAHAKPARTSLPEALRAALRADGRRLHAISLAAGINPTILQRFESGERTISMETAEKVAAALGLSLELR